MKIRLKNKFLEIRVALFKVPNLQKLERELKDFFEKNKIDGYIIKEFGIVESPNEIDYKIVPLRPHLTGLLSGLDDREIKIRDIGKKYGIKNLGFVYWSYRKLCCHK